jgi:hypothetical protein
MRWCSSKSVPTKIMSISSSSPYLHTAPQRSCEPSRALPFERSSPGYPRSKSTFGVENSGPMATTSLQSVAPEVKEKSSATLRPKDDRRNTSNCTFSNSSYSETVRLHPIPRLLGGCEEMRSDEPILFVSQSSSEVTQYSVLLLWNRHRDLPAADRCRCSSRLYLLLCSPSLLAPLLVLPSVNLPPCLH